MKNLKLLILLVLSPLTFFAQQLTGLWIGTLSNDSTSIRQDQSFEIALTEYKGKVYGYSRSTFIVNDTLYYIMKRVKGTIEGNVCEVKDDEIISCNFQKRLEKKVKVIHTFRMNETDSTWELDGDWKTTQTKKYYSVSGKTDLKEEKDVYNSKLFPHLEELNLAKEVPFYVEQKKIKDDAIAKQLVANKAKPTSIRTVEQTGINRPDVAINKPSSVRTNTVAIDNNVVTPDERAQQTGIATEQQTGISKPNGVGSMPSTSVKTNTVAVNNEIVTPDERAQQTNISTEQQAAINRTGSTSGKATTSVKTNTIKVNNEVVTPDEKAQQTAIATQQQAVNKPITNNNKPTSVRTTTVPVNNGIAKVEEKKQPVNTQPANTIAKVEDKKPAPVADKPNTTTTSTMPVAMIAKNVVADPSGAASHINERKTDAQQTVEFRADSIVIAVYDNGEIDGDTVSVLLNGEVVVAKQGLKASASKKTLYLPATGDQEFSLVLYAENLGKYPPNTGLLVIYDGEDRHYVRFSADLQKNAGVVLRRKK